MEPAAYFRFRYFDPRKRRWMVARYRARVDSIAERGQPFQLLPDPEYRAGSPGHFSPFPEKPPR